MSQVIEAYTTQQTKSAFSKSLFWLGSAQVMGRIVRLASSIILARLFTPEVFGQVAIILTCFELICTPTRRITSASLIKMNDVELATSLPNANKLNWLAAITAFVAMSLLSWPLALYHQDTILMATSYLLLPFSMLYAANNLRANRMRVVGRAILWQTVADGVLTAIFALLGLGIWAIILPKVLVIFIWMTIHRHNNPLPKTEKPLHTHQSIPKMLYFGSMVGLSDLSISLRQNIDYLLIGYFLGLEALGIYFFAFNTSLGISLGIIQSYGTALYSHLCGSKKNKPNVTISNELKTRYNHSLSLILKIAIPVIAIQSILSPFYLPLVYGNKWVEAGALPIFILLCLSGLVRPIGEAASQLLISINKSRLNLTVNLGFTFLLAITITVCSQWGLTAVALGILLIHIICMPTLHLYIQLFVLSASAISTENKALNSSKCFNQEIHHDA